MSKIAVIVGLMLLESAHAEPVTYSIDPTHTFAWFEVPHFDTSSVRARFDRKEGTVQLDRAARTGRAEITIDATSINSGVPAFDGHLKGKDFLNAAEHPSVKFVADQFGFAGDRLTEVTGTLTMAGRTVPVTLKASNFNCYTSPLFKREVCGGDFEATIQRSRWGMVYGLPNIAPDNVRLLIQVEAIRQ